MPSKKNKGIYCIPKDTIDFREIAKIMTSLGYPMTHGTAYFFFNRAISKLITHSFTNLVNSDQSIKDDFSEQDLQDIIHNFQKNTELWAMPMVLVPYGLCPWSLYHMDFVHGTCTIWAMPMVLVP